MKKLFLAGILMLLLMLIPWFVSQALTVPQEATSFPELDSGKPESYGLKPGYQPFPDDSLRDTKAREELAQGEYRFTWISGMPDYEQWWVWSLPPCYVGCTPTASGNIVGYWTDHGYPALMSGSSGGETTICAGSCTTAVERLRQLMQTYCDYWLGDWKIDPSGFVKGENIVPGLQSYFSEKGYTFQIQSYWDPSFGALLEDYYLLYRLSSLKITG
ncbi:MAG: hypothetical protein FJ011_06490 [Chloroflexi bacterium]|nr:hypothetical protein [Chloroflexota bacterium]